MSGQLQTPAGPDGAVAEILTAGGKLASELATPEEQQTVKMVRDMLAKAKQWKQTWAKDHPRFRDLWESNHYTKRRPHTLSQAVINQVWSAVETFIAHITDAIPEPTTHPRLPEFKDNAKLITKWLQYISDSNSLETELEHPVREACVTGCGWVSIEWNQNLAGGRGDVEIRPRSDQYIFTSPYARNLKEALYLIDASNVPRDYILRAWPERGALVPPSPSDAALSNVHVYESVVGDAGSEPTHFTTTDGSNSGWSDGKSTIGMKKADLVTLIKCYIKQDDGPMRLIVIANNVVMQDGPIPYEDDDFPYANFNVLPTMDTIQGRGLVQFIEGLQEVLNNTMSYLLDQQRFCSDPMLLVSAANLEEGTLVDNSPGAILPDLQMANGGGAGYQWLQAPGFNQAWLQIHEVITNYMDSVLGRVEIIKGERPAGVDTLGGLEVLRDEANIRLRKHIKWVRASMKRVYLLSLSRLRQFAHDERHFRIEGKFGQDEFVTVNPSTGFAADASETQEATIPEDAEFEVIFNRDVPGGRQAKLEFALSLAGAPAEDGLPMVDRQWVLEQAEVDEAPEIIERLSAMQEQQAAAEQQAMQAESGQPQPQASPVDQIMAMFGG